MNTLEFVISLSIVFGMILAGMWQMMILMTKQNGSVVLERSEAEDLERRTAHMTKGQRALVYSRYLKNKKKSKR